jgi:hypothetical protein
MIMATTLFDFTPAAEAIIEEMAIEPQDDVDAIRRGEWTKESLLAYCLEADAGTPMQDDPKRIQAWNEYVDGVFAAVGG